MYEFRHKVRILGQQYFLAALTTPKDKRMGFQFCPKPKLNQGLLFIFDREQPHYFHMRNVCFDLMAVCYSSDGDIVGQIPMYANVENLYQLPECRYVIEVPLESVQQID